MAVFGVPGSPSRRLWLGDESSSASAASASARASAFAAGSEGGRHPIASDASFALLLVATARTPAAAAATSSGTEEDSPTAADRSGARAPSAWRSSATSTGRTRSSSSSSASRRSGTLVEGSEYIAVRRFTRSCSVGFARRSSSASLTSLRFASVSGVSAARRSARREEDGVFFAAAGRAPLAGTSRDAPAAADAISRSLSGSECSIAQLNRPCMLSGSRSSSESSVASGSADVAPSASSNRGRPAAEGSRACARTAHAPARRSAARRSARRRIALRTRGSRTRRAAENVARALECARERGGGRRARAVNDSARRCSRR